MNATNQPDPSEADDDIGAKFTPEWAADAPRGGRAVLTRILKEEATVPLFFAQTLVQSLRDVGYNTTTSALCEHVDNAIEAGATEVRIFFRQAGRRGAFETDIMVYDNGRGMPSNVLKVATAFGGSMSYGNRHGIGRFGMGMKTAALSMSPMMELYSWQEARAFYSMSLDTNAIGRDRRNLVDLPEPSFNAVLPAPVADMFSRPMGFPKDASEQNILADGQRDIYEELGPHGTIVFMPDCDRLTYATDRKLVEHCVTEMARVYRRQISAGLRVYVNNRVTQAVDPTYSMTSARHTSVEGLTVKTSRLVIPKTVQIPLSDTTTETAPVHIKLYALPIEDWSGLPRKVLNSNLHLYDGQVVSILRNDREVYAGFLPGVVERHSENFWLRVEIDFSGELDEAFGVAANKQGVRLKSYAIEKIGAAIKGELTTVREEIRRVQAQRATQRASAKPSASEARATEADAFQPERLDMPLSDNEKEQMEGNLRGLSIGLRREDETEEGAYQRVLASKFLITFKHDQYWPFYHVEHRFGRVILTINTAHEFFTHLYKPLLDLEMREAVADEAEGASPVDKVVPASKGPVLALDLLLFSLARTQSVLSRDSEEAAQLFDTLRRNWSDAYRIQLTA